MDDNMHDWIAIYIYIYINRFKISSETPFFRTPMWFVKKWYSVSKSTYFDNNAESGDLGCD